MGLRQGRGKPVELLLHWRLPLAIASVCTLAATAGAAGRMWLRYDRGGIAAGEWWRLLTGHIVHLGWSHLALNIAGLVLSWILVGRRFSTGQWCWLLLLTAAAIDAGLWIFDPQISWYVGLSGVLHGLLMAGVIGTLAERPLEAVPLGILLIAKIAWEQAAGPLPGSAFASGGDVVVDAHLYGAIGGALAAAIAIRVRAAASI